MTLLAIISGDTLTTNIVIRSHYGKADLNPWSQRDSQSKAMLWACTSAASMCALRSVLVLARVYLL